MTYTAVFEPTADGGWSAYVPDLPGVGIVGASLDEVRRELPPLVTFHVEGLRSQGLPVQEPSGLVVGTVTVPAA